MPTNHRLRLHDDQHMAPTGPETTQGRPKPSVKGIHSWSRLFPMEHGKLLPQGQDLQSVVSPTAEEHLHQHCKAEDEC
jgi:hypothetical protein